MSHGISKTKVSNAPDSCVKTAGGAVRGLIMFLGVLCALEGCAHRGRPPECKGPYTPINQSLVASSDGTQR